MQMMRLRLPAGLAALCFVGAAHAHAFLDKAEPRVGSVVQAAPAEVRLQFSEALEPAFSRIEVSKGDGSAIDVSPARVDPDHRELLRVALPRLAPGIYVVKWRAVSVDTHASEGRYVFTVRP